MLESSDTQQIIDEINRIQRLHGFKIRVMYSTVEKVAKNFNCYYTSKEECFNYWLPKILCELFEIDKFDSNKEYLVNKTDHFSINWIYDVHRLNSVEELVSPAHGHWQTAWRNKLHPGWGRTSLVAFGKENMPMTVVITDYSNSWSHLPLLTDELLINEKLFYSGIRFDNFDQPYYEFKELAEGFNYRWKLDFPVEVKYIDHILYFSDIPILTLGFDPFADLDKETFNKVTFFEYTGTLFKDKKQTFYKNLQEWKVNIKKRT